MAVRTKGRKIDKDGGFAVFISGSASLPASVLKFSPCKNEKDYYKRMWRNWQTRRFQVPVGNSVWVQIPSSAPKNDKFRQKFVVFYSSRRLGMESRVSVYDIAVGVWHHQRCIFLRLDSIRLLCNQFHTATSCGFHAGLRRD